jgi:hypothetical protein
LAVFVSLFIPNLNAAEALFDRQKFIQSKAYIDYKDSNVAYPQVIIELTILKNNEIILAANIGEEAAIKKYLINNFNLKAERLITQKPLK